MKARHGALSVFSPSVKIVDWNASGDGDGSRWLERRGQRRIHNKWAFRECAPDGVTRSEVNAQCYTSGQLIKGILDLLDERRGAGKVIVHDKPITRVLQRYDHE
jgi:hypothetical protein